MNQERSIGSQPDGMQEGEFRGETVARDEWGVIMEGKAITFPGPDEMRQQLVAVSSHPFLVEQFYPKLLVDAGKTTDAKGIVRKLILASFPLAIRWPSELQRSELMPRIIDILASDAEVADRAKEIYAKGPEAMQSK